MTGFVLLDVAIGVIFALLVFSLIASALHEAFAGNWNWRGHTVRRGIHRIIVLGPTGMPGRVYEPGQ